MTMKQASMSVFAFAIGAATTLLMFWAAVVYFQLNHETPHTRQLQLPERNNAIYTYNGK